MGKEVIIQQEVNTSPFISSDKVLRVSKSDAPLATAGSIIRLITLEILLEQGYTITMLPYKR